MTELYFHYDRDGSLLYVGVSLSVLARIAAHRATSAWFERITRIEIERYDTRKEALKAELEAIRTRHPLFNVTGVRAKPKHGQWVRNEQGKWRRTDKLTIKGRAGRRGGKAVSAIDRHFSRDRGSAAAAGRLSGEARRALRVKRLAQALLPATESSVGNDLR